MKNFTDYQSHFRSLFNSTIHITPLDFHELPNLLARTMEAVELYKTLSSREKFDLVFDVMSRAIKGTNASDIKKDVALSQLDSLIENFIRISRGAVNVNNKEIQDPKTKSLIQISEKVYKEVKEMYDYGKISTDELARTLPFLVTSVSRGIGNSSNNL